MNVTTVSKSILALSLMAGLSLSASASGTQPDSMAEWKAQANASISKVMAFPASATNRAASGNAQFKVTVDREGRVVASEQKIRPTSHTLNFASKRAVQRAQFPELPKSFAADQLTFTLNLNYQSGRNVPHRQKLREGIVSGTDIASNASGVQVELSSGD